MLCMAKTTSFALGKHFETFLQRQVSTGRYASASEVVREALRGLEAREQARKDLERLLDEGIESAESEPLLGHDEVWSQLRGRRAK